MSKKPAIKLHTFQIGSPRRRGEGLRLGTVRYLPRGITKNDYARLDYFDVWLPVVAPSRKLIRWLKSADVTDKGWAQFTTRYEQGMLTTTDSRQAIKLIAAISKTTLISVGCYCEDKRRCHRSLLRKLIEREATG